MSRTQTFYQLCVMSLFLNDSRAPSRPGLSHYWGLEISLRHTTLSRTPLEEWSSHRRDLYLTTHNTQKTQTSLLRAGIEPAIPASELPQTHALDRGTTGIGVKLNYPQHCRFTLYSEISDSVFWIFVNSCRLSYTNISDLKDYNKPTDLVIKLDTNG
jgi:hypothetical protein